MCDYSNCARLATLKGLCFGHYQQQLRGEELRPLRGRRVDDPLKNCEMPHCTEQVTRARFCKAHQRIVRLYNLSNEQVQEIFDPYQCGICGKSDEILHVDHDHACCNGNFSCGKCVRGALCRWCNTRVGILEDKNWMLNATAYLSLDNNRT